MGPGRTAETSDAEFRCQNSEGMRGLLCPFADARSLTMDTQRAFLRAQLALDWSPSATNYEEDP
jgi:hypothetical protein